MGRGKAGQGPLYSALTSLLQAGRTQIELQ